MSGAEGVLFSVGGRFAGFSFFAQNNRLQFVYNYFDLERFFITAREALPKGMMTLRAAFRGMGENQGVEALFTFTGKLKKGSDRVEKRRENRDQIT